MDHRKVLTVFLLFNALGRVNQEELTRNFSCCELPYKIPIDLTHEHEFSIGNKTLAVASGSTFNAVPPFVVHGKATLALDKCVSFNQKIFVKNKYDRTEETIVLHHSQPCNTTTPYGQPEGQTSAAVIVAVVLVVLVGVIGIIGVIVWILKKKKETEGNNVI